MERLDRDTTLDLPKEEVLRWTGKTGNPGKDGGHAAKEDGPRERGFRITHDDLQMFLLLLHHKFFTLELLARRFDPKSQGQKKALRPSLYYRLNRMVKEGFLHTIRKDGYQLFLLAEAGLQAIRDLNKAGLPIVNLAELATVHHDLSVANLRFYFEECGAINWTTERQLYQLAAEKPKLPDGAFRWRNRFVFVEVEFSQKSIARYEKIYAHYARKGGPDLVLYFFQKRAHVQYLSDLAKGNPRFAFFPYVEKMPRPADAAGFSALRDTTIQKKLEELA